MAITSVPAQPSPASLHGHRQHPCTAIASVPAQPSPAFLALAGARAGSACGDMPCAQRSATASCEMCFLKETCSPRCHPPRCSPHSQGQEEESFQIGHGEGGETPSSPLTFHPRAPRKRCRCFSHGPPSSPVSSTAWRVASVIMAIIVSCWDELCNFPPSLSFCLLSPVSRAAGSCCHFPR